MKTAQRMNLDTWAKTKLAGLKGQERTSRQHETNRASIDSIHPGRISTVPSNQPPITTAVQSPAFITPQSPRAILLQRVENLLAMKVDIRCR